MVRAKKKKQQYDRPFCRMCADHNGVCPLDGSFCSPTVEARHRELVIADRRLRMHMLTNAVKKVLTTESVESLAAALSAGLARGEQK